MGIDRNRLRRRWWFRNSTFRSEADVRAGLSLPVLSVIPFMDAGASTDSHVRSLPSRAWVRVLIASLAALAVWSLQA